LGTHQSGSRAVVGTPKVTKRVITSALLDDTPDTCETATSRKPRNYAEEKTRAHISEYIQYEMEVEGIESGGVDAPAAEWDLDLPRTLLAGRSTNKSLPLNKALPVATYNGVHAQTCYVPHKGTHMFGSPESQERIHQVCSKHEQVFNTVLNSQPALVAPKELSIDTATRHTNKNKGQPRKQARVKQAEITKQCDLLSQNIIQQSQADDYSQVRMPKQHQTPTPSTPMKWRFCCDMRNETNATSTVSEQSIPNPAQMMQRIEAQRPNIVGQIDLTSGYHQAPLSVNSRVFTASSTKIGVHEWLRVPMGLRGAPPYL